MALRASWQVTAWAIPRALWAAPGSADDIILARAINSKPFQCSDRRKSPQLRCSATRVEQGDLFKLTPWMSWLGHWAAAALRRRRRPRRAGTAGATYRPRPPSRPGPGPRRNSRCPGRRWPWQGGPGRARGAIAADTAGDHYSHLPVPVDFGTYKSGYDVIFQVEWNYNSIGYIIALNYDIIVWYYKTMISYLWY